VQPFARFPQKAPQPGAFLHSWFCNRYFPVPFLLALAFVLLPLAAAARTEGGTVQHVVDGDSVILTDQRQVRLIGINCPGVWQRRPAGRTLAAAARDRLRELVQGRTCG
jgi:endonuclease YncB( thermonuclease family)